MDQPERPTLPWRVAAYLFGTTIKRHERGIVVLLGIDLFILLTVYYILKIVREPLILLEGGVVSRNAARGVQALLLMGLVPAYSYFANRFPPRRLVTGVLAFFLASLMVFPVLALAHVPLGFAFFVWLGIFSITAIAQFWSLANDLFTEEAGKRLFPVIAAGATVGAVVGSQLVVFTSHWLPPAGFILVAGGLLAICILITHLARRAAEKLPNTPHNGPTPDPRGGFRLVLSDRYLLVMGLAILLLNLINTTGDQVMAMVVQDHAKALVTKAARAEFMMTFYGGFQTWVSILTAILQVFVVGRVIRATGVRGALMVLPLLAFAGYGFVALVPVLAMVRGLKVIENSTEYSLQNTVQQVLFLPTSRDVKYKGKTATDTFFVRFGDLGSWALVALALKAGWGPIVLSLVNVGVAAVWLVLVLLLGRRYQALTKSMEAAAASTTAEGGASAPLMQPAPAK